MVGFTTSATTVTSPSGNGGLLVGAVGMLAAAAATTSVAIIIRQRRKRQTIGDKLDTVEPFSLDPVVSRASPRPVWTSKISGREETSQSTAQLLLQAAETPGPRFTAEERLQALAHVKSRAARLRSLHEAEGLDHYHTPAYLSRHASAVSSPPMPVPPSVIYREDDRKKTVDRLPSKLLSIVVRKDNDEHSKDGTEVTDVSDFCSSSSLDSSSSESFVSEYDAEESLERASYSGLCSEVLALIGGIAGAFTLLNV